MMNRVPHRLLQSAWAANQSFQITATLASCSVPSSSNTCSSPPSPIGFQQQQRWLGTHSPPSTRHVTGEVPAGHLNSDLSRATCHIGLNRLRDLTMRQDLCLWEGKTKRSLREMFKDKKVIVVGFPGGKVCTEQHIPGYVKLTEELSKRGVDKVLCVTPNTPDALEELRAREDLKSPKVELLGDGNGGFVRMLGFELGVIEGAGPKCQRFAAIVDNGILLKVRIETSPAEVKTTDCKSMLELWDDVFVKKV